MRWPSLGRGVDGRRRRSCRPHPVPFCRSCPTRCSAPGAGSANGEDARPCGYASCVRARMGANCLDAGLAQKTFVAVPAVELIGERSEIVLHPSARIGEEVVEVDPVGPVRLLRKQLRLDGLREPARRRPVVGADDPVEEKRAFEGQPGIAAARDGVVAEANPLCTVHRPRRLAAATANAAADAMRVRHGRASARGRNANTSSAWLPGRTRTRSATPAPRAAKRPARGRRGPAPRATTTARRQRRKRHRTPARGTGSRNSGTGAGRRPWPTPPSPLRCAQRGTRR